MLLHCERSRQPRSTETFEVENLFQYISLAVLDCGKNSNTLQLAADKTYMTLQRIAETTAPPVLRRALYERLARGEGVHVGEARFRGDLASIQATGLALRCGLSMRLLSPPDYCRVAVRYTPIDALDAALPYRQLASAPCPMKYEKQEVKPTKHRFYLAQLDTSGGFRGKLVELDRDIQISLIKYVLMVVEDKRVLRAIDSLSVPRPDREYMDFLNESVISFIFKWGTEVMKHL